MGEFLTRLAAQMSVKQRWLKAPVYVAVGTLILVWLFNTPGGLLGKADAIGYAVCHRIDWRSFHLGERPISMCARCTGMYLGALVGLATQQYLGRRRVGTPPWPVLVIAGGLAFSFVIDGVNSYLTMFPGFPYLYEPNNVLRLFTGSGMGVALSVALFPAFNLTVWKDPQPQAALTSLKSMAALIGLVILVNGLVLTENPLLLYPLTLISAAGVLIILSMVYCMVWVMLMRRDNHYDSIWEMALPLVAGFGMALMQIAALDLVRYLLTGSWSGFHIG